MTPPRFIIIVGPTAVGKTDIAVALSSDLPIEIINADVGQLYTPLTIGTAKPDWQAQPVPHHLFDVCSAPENFTVLQFRIRVMATMREIWQRGNMPVLVGGSGFYLKSLLFPPHENSVATDDVELHGDWKDLQAIDPERAKQLHPNDLYRIQRALALWRQTGKLPSTLKPNFAPVAPFDCFILMRDRQELYERIDKRVELMLDAGWIEETKKLLGTPWEPFLMKKKIIGYDFIIQYLHDKMSKAALIAAIAQETRNYAKRQITFFRSFVEQIDVGLQENSSIDAHCSTIMCSGKKDNQIVQELLRALR
jgi:tRNA dimethylallyltransferase